MRSTGRKKILLTGGNGFIGRNIRESYLARTYDMYAPSSKELNLCDTDKVDAYFSNQIFDAVIHAGAKPGHRNAPEPDVVFLANSRMFFNLVRNQEKGRFGRLINIGSGAIYDMRYYEPKMSESHFGQHIPVDEHGYNKYVCEKVIENSPLDMVDFRVFGIFGPYEDYAIRFISNAICKTLFDLPISLRQDRYFDYLCINDLFQVLEYFIENKAKHKAYNITPNNSVSLYELACMVRKIAGKEYLPIQVAKPGLGLEYSGSNLRLKTECTELHFTPIEQAVKELYLWYTAHKNEINRELLLVDR